MKKLIVLFAMIAAFSASSFAQIPQGSAHHEATLTWNQDVGATGFNVYRSLLPGGPFAVISTAPVPEPPSTSTTLPSFIDVNVVQGTTYSWCVTALATISTGVFETACSNVVTVKVPNDPIGPPGGLSVVAQ